MRYGFILLLLACTGCLHIDRDGSQPMNINLFSSRQQKVYPTSDLETAGWRKLGHDRDTSDLSFD